jgi:hypothetical protein
MFFVAIQPQMLTATQSTLHATRCQAESVPAATNHKLDVTATATITDLYAATDAANSAIS